jgi:aspartyl-tRNA(Asn)/glutamyl-tRNA(Gln) amidotransferase subunit C
LALFSAIATFRQLLTAGTLYLTPIFFLPDQRPTLYGGCFIGELPMALERCDVEKIAHLARVGLTEADIPHTTATLNNILGLIDAMQAVDTSSVEPLAHPLETAQRLRADLVTENNHREAYQAIAPAVEAGLFLVPQVIE